MSKLDHNSNENLHHAGTLEVHLLGLVDFDAMLGLQAQLSYEISGRNDTAGTLLLCEHPPIISVGREGSTRDLHISHVERQRTGMTVRWISRGGGAFAHGPGQLAAYLMVPLDRLHIGVSDYRQRLESAICDACHELKVPAKRHDASPGIWGRGGQLGFFGSGVRSWVTCHGLFLNVCIHHELLSMTSPNADRERATSIQAHRREPVQMSQLRESVARRIAEQFGYETSDVSTGHPLLKRTTQRVRINA